MTNDPPLRGPSFLAGLVAAPVGFKPLTVDFFKRTLGAFDIVPTWPPSAEITMSEITSKKDSELCYAVRNTVSRFVVGMYTQQKAQALADEWNELAYRVRRVRPYEIVHYVEVGNRAPKISIDQHSVVYDGTMDQAEAICAWARALSPGPHAPIVTGSGEGFYPPYPEPFVLYVWCSYGVNMQTTPVGYEPCPKGHVIRFDPTKRIFTQQAE